MLEKSNGPSRPVLAIYIIKWFSQCNSLSQNTILMIYFIIRHKANFRHAIVTSLVQCSVMDKGVKEGKKEDIYAF